MNSPVLQVADLRVAIGRHEIVHGLTFQVEPEGTLGIVGESGSGKSMTVLAATGLLDAPGAHVTGSSVLAGAGENDVELVGARPATLRRVHGDRVGFVFQDPSTSLNPLLTLERQITESLEAHRNMTRRAAAGRALELLEAVGLPDPAQRMQAYPHQLSGGQRQRVMIAIALACDPALLIADEPTTALDVTTQAQIIELVRTLQRERGTAVVWISHDLGVIGQVADDVLVLRHGETVEHRDVVDLMDEPHHPYTRELLAARPRLGASAPPAVAAEREALLSVSGLDVKFPVTSAAGRSIVHAVDHVSFEVHRGRAGHRGGVRVGEVDDRERPHGSGQAHWRFGGHGWRGRAAPRLERPAAPDRDGVPGPVLLAGPTDARGREHRRAATGAQASQRRQEPPGANR